mmetsp:Transcript_6273/g.15126  ORF Transcript_6273/g.15126 Transcript_6273/m.15126 type:complete len:765 (-) Transcript_6273:274-2568(-)
MVVSPVSSARGLMTGPNMVYAAMGTFLAACAIAGLATSSGGVLLFTFTLAALLVVGELLYSKFLARKVFGIRPSEPVPSKDPAHQGNIDYHASDPFLLFGHHFTSIAGAAPIVGPSIAMYYGWLPCLIWIVGGVIFAGAVHDFGALVLAARNKGRSIGDMCGIILSPRCGILFLCLLSFFTWQVIAVFVNVIAKLWIDFPETVLPVNGQILVAVAVGVLWRYKKQQVGIFWPSVVALVALYVLIWLGVAVDERFDHPFQVVRGSICRNAVMEEGCDFGGQQVWTIVIGVIIFFSSLLPVWLLVQSRDAINALQLETCMLGLFIGLLVVSPSINADIVRSAETKATEASLGGGEGDPLFPMLFVTIACGAVSGIHGLIGSIVTSKQLSSTTHARPIGYGGMLGEAALAALVTTICATMVTYSDAYATWKDASGTGLSNFIRGGGALMASLGIPVAASRAVVVVMVVSFASTTLDTCTRIQRMLIAEVGDMIDRVVHVEQATDGPVAMWKRPVRVLTRAFQHPFVGCTLAVVPAIFLANSRTVDSLWQLFGATNQMVAALNLLTISVYLLRLTSSPWKALTYFAPFVWLIVMTSWALRVQLSSWLTAPRLGASDWLAIIIGFLIACLVAWIVLEVALWIAQGKYKHDSRFICEDEDGRVGTYKMTKNGIPPAVETRSADFPAKKSSSVIESDAGDGCSTSAPRAMSKQDGSFVTQPSISIERQYDTEAAGEEDDFDCGDACEEEEATRYVRAFFEKAAEHGTGCCC